MKKQNKNISYRPGRIGRILESVCETFSLDEAKVYDFVTHQYPELLKPERCSNCNASMAEYIYTVSIADADLLCAMGSIIAKKIKKGMDFTTANQVHLQSEISNYTIVSRMTIASKLGLIAKVMRKDRNGKMVHDSKAGWLITRRGYQFLSGEAIPRKVKVFRNEIQERFGEMTTLTEVYRGQNKNMEEIAYMSGVLVESYHNPKML